MKRLAYDTLCRQVAAQLDAGPQRFTLGDVRAVVEALRDQLRAALRRGEVVHLPGLLTLRTSTRRARVILNPRTGARMAIDETRGLRARACKGALR